MCSACWVGRSPDIAEVQRWYITLYRGDALLPEVPVETHRLQGGVLAMFPTPRGLRVGKSCGNHCA